MKMAREVKVILSEKAGALSSEKEKDRARVQSAIS